MKFKSVACIKQKEMVQTKKFMSNLPKIIHLSSYLPRKCGIATYTHALDKSMKSLHPALKTGVIGVRETGGKYTFPYIVKKEISESDPISYLKAAQYVNRSKFNVINLQHEFGLFTPVHGVKLKIGEDDGKNILEFLRRIKKPVVTTLHMVFPKPPKHHREVVKEIINRSVAVATIVDIAAYFLLRDYAISEEKIHVIPHGVPNIELKPTTVFKRKLGIPEDQLVISTFGLIRAKKGIEFAINAMPMILREFPDAHYYIVGDVHPQRPKEYMDFLKNEVKKAGIQRNVHFVQRFLEYSELLDWLQATNVFLAPFVAMEAISSGTLIYAMGAGRACVATPFVFAKQVLADNRGIIITPRSRSSISDAVIQLFKNPGFRHDMQKRAYKYAHSRIWSKVAKQYFNLFTEASQVDINGAVKGSWKYRKNLEGY